MDVDGGEGADASVSFEGLSREVGAVGQVEDGFLVGGGGQAGGRGEGELDCGSAGACGRSDELPKVSEGRASLLVALSGHWACHCWWKWGMKRKSRQGIEVKHNVQMVAIVQAEIGMRDRFVIHESRGCKAAIQRSLRWCILS